MSKCEFVRSAGQDYYLPDNEHYIAKHAILRCQKACFEIGRDTVIASPEICDKRNILETSI